MIDDTNTNKITQFAKTRKDRLLYWLIIQVGRLQEYLYEKLDRPVWRSWNGEVSPLDEINDGHLINIAKKQRRENRKGGVQIVVRREIERRGLWSKVEEAERREVHYERRERSRREGRGRFF